MDYLETIFKIGKIAYSGYILLNTRQRTVSGAINDLFEYSLGYKAGRFGSFTSDAFERNAPEAILAGKDLGGLADDWKATVSRAGLISLS